MNGLSFVEIMSSHEFVSPSVTGNFEDFELESKMEEQISQEKGHKMTIARAF